MADNTEMEPSERKSGPGTMTKIFGVIMGGGLLLLAIGMIIEGSGIQQSGQNRAFAYLIGLVGLAMIGLAFFKDILSYNSGEKGPVGGITAQGSAAIIGIGVAFILLMNPGSDNGLGEGGDKNGGSTTSGEASSGGVLTTGGSASSGETTTSGVSGEHERGDIVDDTEFDLEDFDDAIPEVDETPVVAAAIPVTAPTFLAWPYDQSFQLAPNLVSYRTFSNSGCPTGPSGCGFAGAAAHFNPQMAQNFAVQMCVGNGGIGYECQTNLEQF